MSGWFAVPRGITTLPGLDHHPERLAVVLWMLEHALWKGRSFDLNGTTVNIPRGALVASQDQIAKATGVGRQVVRTLLTRLETDGFLTRRETNGCTVITICDYERFQPGFVPPNPAANPRATEDQPLKEESNKEKVSSGGNSRGRWTGGRAGTSWQSGSGRGARDDDRFGAFGRIPEVG